MTAQTCSRRPGSGPRCDSADPRQVYAEQDPSPGQVHSFTSALRNNGRRHDVLPDDNLHSSGRCDFTKRD